jgi:hypothetical protein
VIKVLKVIFWTLAAALIISDATMLGVMYFKPRDLLRKHIEEPRTNFRLLAINDNRSLRSGDISWTFSLQRQHELALRVRCKREATLGAVGAIYKIEAEPSTHSTLPSISPSPKQSRDGDLGCLLATWTDVSRNGGGEAILSGNLVQVNTWYD